ncbi:hypothetical protein EDB83DRAFT_843595 [Lactarius deliciosus]|nr:hypothetical protein EDB83DRAFT_843595 [Lactarius deliciosus]
MAVPTVAPRSLLVPPFFPIYRRGTDSPLTGLPIQLREVEKDVPTRTSALETGAMLWLLHSLTHEQELERFLTGFYKSSSSVKDPAQILRRANTDEVPKAIVAVMNHLLSSDLPSHPIRQQRIEVCLMAVRTDLYLLQRTFHHAFCSTESAIFKSADFVLLADQYADDDDSTTRSLARCIVAVAINRFEDYQSDERWAGIIQQSVKLRNLVQLAWELYAAHPGSVSHKIFRNSLHVACQLHVETAAPHEFCGLWNQLVAAAQVWPEHLTFRSNVMLILSFIRTIYIPLHRDTESQLLALSASTGALDPVLRDPSSYFRFTVSSHSSVTSTV